MNQRYNVFMNRLLPNIDEIKPITDTSSIFNDCGFNRPFDELSFQKRLEVINDIIRQTIYTDSRPNPINHTETMIGNCHTASLVLIKYLKHLNIGKNHRYAFSRIKPYEPDDVLTKHVIVLLEDEFDNTYQLDATPYVGYKYGSVCKLSDYRFYEEYEVVYDDTQYLLDRIRELMHADKNGLINFSNIDYYNSILYECLSYKALNGYSSHCAKILMNYEFDIDKKIEMMSIVRLDPYSNFSDDLEHKLRIKKELLYRQIKKWKEELYDLKASNTNPKRQLELLQMIVQELCFTHERYEKRVIINGKEYHLSHLTPRFFYENGTFEDSIEESMLFYKDYYAHKLMTRFMYPNVKLKKKVGDKK